MNLKVKNTLGISGLCSISILVSRCRRAYCDAKETSSYGLAYDLPVSSYQIQKEDDKDINKWVVDYNAFTRNPKYTYEYLTNSKSSEANPNINRKNSKFHAESSIISPFQVHPNDYNNSGYDRGHMVPAADFSQSQVGSNNHSTLL